MKVAIFGCGGIIGQHMMISVPAGVEPLYVRKTPSPIAETLDLTDWDATKEWLNRNAPDVIVNLAGESRPDEVERVALNPDSMENYTAINTYVPVGLARWCDQNSAHLIQVGTQASFSEPGPSGPPANHYGHQKETAETWIKENAQNWTIVRPTFVLGIRPFPGIGRENPAESILKGQFKQVNDRFFSVSFAWEVAEVLWQCALKRYSKVTLNVGHKERLSRYDVARAINPKVDFAPVAHSSFEGLAPRGYDTHYIEASSWSGRPVDEGFARLRMTWLDREQDELIRRSWELAAFLKLPWQDCQARLAQGFGKLHNAVAEDFRKSDPKTEDELLEWYRSTEAYLWELTAYHCDAGFNYSGQCRGIIEALVSKGVKRVMNLGDGVGTLTIKMREAGMDPVYHDLLLSRTADFARARMAARLQEMPDCFGSLTFYIGAALESFDTITSMDFLEHVPNVEEWVRAIFEGLKPGGYFVAQNGFNCGSGPDGSIPMHLACNDRYEKDWDPLLTQIGFVQIASNWYQKPV